ncbi:MAG: YcxB family protein [Brucellaceae bacterium]|jgi:hypothetical protein|nr:YcxB family protein [Brucellaceae bacterium]
MDSADQNARHILIQLEKKDVQQAAKLHFQKMTFTPLTMSIVLIVSLIYGAGLYYFIDYRGVVEVSVLLRAMLIAFFSFSLAFAVMVVVNYYVFTRKILKQQKSLFRASQIHWDETGTHFKSEIGESRLKWDEFIKLHQNKNMILLYISDYLFFILPKRLMTDDQAADIGEAWSKREI